MTERGDYWMTVDTVQRERLFPDEALKPTLTELIKTSSMQA
jgi:hypothetical protein